MTNINSWENLALLANNIAFDADGTKKNIDIDTTKKAIGLFYKSINKGANKYWPYVKLADLIEDFKEKTQLHIEAFKIEPNEFSLRYLSDKIFKDSPELISALKNPEDPLSLLKIIEFELDIKNKKIEEAKKPLYLEKISEITILALIRLHILIGNLEKSQEWLKKLEQLDNRSVFLQKYAFLKDLKNIHGIYKNQGKSLPKDFDSHYYFNTHKELCLGSELDGILHYIEYGFQELRDYKKAPTILIKNKEYGDIILFTQYYLCDDITKKEIIYCLKKNLNNKFINKVVVFCEKQCYQEFLLYELDKKHKLQIIPVLNRLTFEYWFKYSYKNHPNAIKILANSDIYFDDTIDVLRQLEYTKDILYSCSRVDLDEEGNLVKSRVDKSPDSPVINNTRSQDCWIFKNKLINFETNFILGYENCDILLKHKCTSSGCNFLNLCDHIRCIHIDSKINKVRKRYNLITDKLEFFDTDTNNIFKKNNKPILHIFPFEHTDIEDVNYRQSFAIHSYIDNKTINTKILCFGNKNLNINDIDHIEIRSSIKSGGREYFLLSELIDFMLSVAHEDQYLVYTNSDCYIDERFYDFISESDYDYIEFFRQEVEGNKIVGSNKDGIDGFAGNISAIKKIQEKLQGDSLVIGAPYWDAVISNIAREHIENSYQDVDLLFHKKHKPRWSLNSLDTGGQINLKTLDTLYKKEIIHCRKAEIKSDNLVIRVINKNTDINIINKNVVKERFSKNKVTEFDYNYLFIEEKLEESCIRLLNDESIGTTAGTRYFVPRDRISKIIEDQNNLYLRHVKLDDTQTLSASTKFISNFSKKPQLGVVISTFNLDQLRVDAIKRSMSQLQKQSIWNNTRVVFIELLQNQEEASNFDFSNINNINHLKIYTNKFNKNLFQKECLWNIGAKKILNKVDNFIFIDADTYPQNNMVFAKANKILNFNPNIVFQLGNCILTQKENGDIDRVQWLWNSFAKLEAKTAYCFNPCGGFAISKKVFKQINGFNPFGFLYGGDILFLYEIDERSRKIWDHNIKNMNIFKNIPRKIDNKNITIKNDESPMIHCWHGSHLERAYHEWGLAFNNLQFDKNDIVLDENGLLAWSSVQKMNKYSKFFQNKNKIFNSEMQKKLYL
jgi:hypothetical protein